MPLNTYVRRTCVSAVSVAATGANRIVPGTGTEVVVPVPRGQYVAQFGDVPGGGGENQRVEEAERGSRLQVAVDVECVALGDSAGAEEIMRGHIDTSLGATAVRRLGHADSAESVRKG
ncbi:hypothetical protein ACFY4I_21970 [Streptomyces scabiei]|uniref:hypothetical protein n=1 Tax=Streptomyces scabiei TaxID=1930 RepID=UPI0036863013